MGEQSIYAGEVREAFKALTDAFPLIESVALHADSTDAEPTRLSLVVAGIEMDVAMDGNGDRYVAHNGRPDYGGFDWSESDEMIEAFDAARGYVHRFGSEGVDLFDVTLHLNHHDDVIVPGRGEDGEAGYWSMDLRLVLGIDEVRSIADHLESMGYDWMADEMREAIDKVEVPS